MSVQSLGYVGIRAKSLADWGDYGTKLLGLQRIDKSASSLAFRMDDRKQRIIVDQDGGEGIGFFGWEVADGGALDALAAKLDAAGVKVARGARALADERRVKELIVLADPLGNRVEIFHGAETAADPFKPGRSISGFRTGVLGMGHVVLSVKNAEAVMPFYRDLLGFRLSDYYHKPFTAYFMHVNPRHHSLAFVQSGKNAVHPMMMELFSFDDVGQGYDIAQGNEGQVAVTLGRHSGDYMTSFYSWNPSGFMTEYGWGGQVVDDATWKPFERPYGPSIWGHERAWLTEEKRAEAREMRMSGAEGGLRQPVQVIEGNYHLMPGTCPWWDSVKPQKAAG
jgi:2,3-dihydroxybiphenyl 1,2-dioxygenase